MYQVIAFVFNLPWTLIGFVLVMISLPKRLTISKKPFAFVWRVSSFWWAKILPAKKGVRGMALGHVVMLGPLEREKDLEHELVHVEQYVREPFVHFILYNIEYLQNGYRNNKYEVEAYDRAGNLYLD